MTASRTSKVFALSLGQGLTTVVALVSGMVLARVLSKTDLATYRQTMLAYDVLIPLLSLGLGSGIYYFLPTEKTRVRGVVVDGLLLMAGMGLLYAVFIALGGNHLLAKRFSNPAIVSTLAYLVPLPMIMLPAKLLSSVMVVQNQVQKLTAYNVLSSLLLAISVIAACLVWKSPDSMVLTRVGVMLVSGAVAIWLMLRTVPADSWHPSFANMKQMVAYSIPLVGASAMGTISLQLDKLIVSAMCTPEQFAVYSNGAIEIPLIGILTGSIASVIQPDLRRMVAGGDFAGALALFRQAASKSAAILIPAMMFLLVGAEPFILTLFSAKYSGSVLPFRLYLLILPVRIVYFGVFMMALGKSKMILYRSIVGLAFNLVLSIVLVRWMGFIGAIVATIISLYLVACAWNFSVISRAVGCRWWQIVPFGTVFQLAGVSILACAPMLGLMMLDLPWAPVLKLALNGASFVLALAGLAWLLHIEPLTREGVQLWNRLASRWRTA
jgi:O-antigen/teichoic acid export membrane protein